MRIRSGWYVVVSLLGVGIGLSLVYSGAYALFGVAASAWYMAKNWKEVRDPDRAVYMRFGKYIGALESGWHMPIPGIMDCCIIPGRLMTFDLKDQTMYTSQETEISVDLLVAVQLGEDADCLRKAALNLPMEDDPHELKKAGELFQKVILAKARSAVGEYNFKKLLSKKAELEQTAKDNIDGELRDSYGFPVKEVEFYNIDEKVKSAAAKVRIMKKAEADGIKASADALSGNWQAAGVAIASEVAKAAATWSQGGSKDQKKQDSDQKQSDQQSPQPGIAQNVADTVRNVFQGKEEE